MPFLIHFPLFPLITCMSTIKLFYASGKKTLNLIAPHESLSEKQYLALTPRLRCPANIKRSATLSKTEDDMNKVVFSQKNKELVKSYAIYNTVLNPDLGEAERLESLYSFLFQSAGRKLSLREAMRRSDIPNRLKVKEYIDRFERAGLFLPLPAIDLTTGQIFERQRMYLPYYYEGGNERLLLASKLFSFGFNVCYPLQEEFEVYAYCSSIRVIIASGRSTEVFNSLSPTIRRILISDEPVVNFSGIRSYSLSAFMREENFY